jgi:CubicO group peptidase (beta-lactamase class C family)
MSKRRTETWLSVIVLTGSVLLAVVLGLFGYMTATAPLHRNPEDVPSVPLSSAPRRWAKAAQQARQIVHADLIEQNLPGLSVAVGVGGEIVWAEGFGWADLEKRVPVSPDTQFRIGTASTALTSAAVGLLLEQGRVNLDSEIQTYVSQAPETLRMATLRQLMGHVAGVAADGGDEGPLFTQRCERPADALQFLSGHELELLFEPGTQHRISSYGWILVSAAVEAAAETPFVEFMRQQVFEPLAMNDTTSDSATEPMSNRATPYFPRFGADPRYGLHPMREIDYSCYAGASVFISTPSDLVRFAMAIDGGKLLQPATVHLLHTSQRLASGHETGYGLGWDLESVALAGERTQMIGHDGESLGGRVASVMILPEYGIAVAVASNISYADTFGVALKVAQPFAEGTGRRAPK